MSTDIEEYEFEEIFTREQLAELLENIADQIKKGFIVSIPTPIKKDGKIKVTISELINVGISIRARRKRTTITLELISEPTEIPIEESKEEEKEEKEVEEGE